MSLVGEPERSAEARDELPAHSWAAHVGPGLVSTATDNDPSGVVTYSLAGAQFGYDMLWTCALISVDGSVPARRRENRRADGQGPDGEHA
jgi:hypothetical protein